MFLRDLWGFRVVAHLQHLRETSPATKLWGAAFQVAALGMRYKPIPLIWNIRWMVPNLSQIYVNPWINHGFSGVFHMFNASGKGYNSSMDCSPSFLTRVKRLISACIQLPRLHQVEFNSTIILADLYYKWISLRIDRELPHEFASHIDRP